MSTTIASRRGFMLASIASAAMLAAGPSRADGIEPVLTITGELTYLQRIALPDDAVAIVEIKPEDAADGDPVTAETRTALDGRQVPVAFTLEVPRAHLEPGTRYVLRGGILVESAMRWLSEPVAVDTAAARVDVGTLRLSPYEAPPPFEIDGKEMLKGEWRLSEIGGLTLADDANATIAFDEAGTFSGKVCNSYRGSFTVDGAGIEFGRAAATLMACPEPLASQEGALFAAFETAKTFRVGQDGTLAVLDGDGKTLIRARR